MFCSKCGANIDDQAKICPQCGTSSPILEQPTPSPATAPLPRTPSMSQPSSFGHMPMTPEPQTDAKAVWSLVLGIAGLLCFILAAIPAIILGHMARSSIRQSMGRLKGDGMAVAGLVLGYIGVALVPFILIIAAIAIPSLLKARAQANSSAAAATVRTLNTSELTYATDYPAQGYAPDLATLGPGDSESCTSPGTASHACLIDRRLACTSKWCIKDGFKYHADAVGTPGTDFAITATPMTPATGDKSFCSTSDLIVRFKPGLVTEPVTVEECQSWQAI